MHTEDRGEKMEVKNKKCRLLGENNTELETPPYPGILGLQIQKVSSKEAWDLWISQQTKIMNEERLNPLDPAAKERLEKEMVKFFQLNELDLESIEESQ